MSLVKAISPLDGRYAEKIVKLSHIVSEFGLIKNRLFVEIEWFKLLFTIAELGLPQLSETEIKLLDSVVENFNEDECNVVKSIEKTLNHDVKAVEYYLKGKLKTNLILNKYSEFVHFACTSEDINNLSYGLMLKQIQHEVLLVDLTVIKDKLKQLAYTHKDVAMMCRTHGQGASPSTMGKELYNVYYRLERQLGQLANLQILGKINGAVGNYNAHVVSFPSVNWPNIAKHFVENIVGLTFNPLTTQIEPHDYMAEYFDCLRRINTILIDLARDLWGYISINYFKQKVVAGEVGSSTMPHKVNPIDFENSEGNLGLANAILTHLSEKLPISRFQRDLTDSTVQRNIGTAFAYGVLAYSSLVKGLNKLEINHEAINHDLDNNWELLAEPIQMVMRKHNIAGAYEQLKALTRGKKLVASELREFIQQLELPDDDKKRLLELTPANYTGLASNLVEDI
jgi:adenylosuccinate lyase